MNDVAAAAMKVRRCACNAEIVFALHENGAKVRIDAHRVAGAALVLYYETIGIIGTFAEPLAPYLVRAARGNDRADLLDQLWQLHTCSKGEPCTPR